MLGVSIVYAVLIGTAIALIDFSEGYSFGLLAYPVAVATFTLTAAWAVMGVGNYLVRTLLAISVASIVFHGFFFGVLYAEMTISLSLFGTDKLLFWIFAFSFFAASIITQIPFWLLRLASGSHWSFTGTSVKPFIPLRDMFLVMLIFALALSASQWAGRLIIASALDDIVLGSEYFVFDEDNQDGSFQIVTEQNIDQMREDELNQHSIQAPLIATIYFVIPAFFSLPIFRWVFRCKRLISSWALTMLYIMAVLAVVALLLYVIVGSGDAEFEFAMMTTTSVAITYNLVWLPLALIRLTGLQLRTNRHVYPTAQTSQLDTDTIDLKVCEPQHDVNAASSH